MSQGSAHDDMIHVRSGGRRIALYAELGRYFSPDGRLNEPELRACLRRAKQARADQGALDDDSSWLSDYLEDVLSYLEGKGIGPAALRLFELAVEEAPSLGVARVSLSPARMKRLLILAGAGDEARATKGAAQDDKARRIFDAALKVFSERGFHAAKMDEIATISGVAKGTLYRHFKSKEDLLDQLLSETSDEIVRELSTIFTGDGDVLGEIAAFIEQWVGFIEDNHVLYRLIQTEGFVVPRTGKRKMFYEYLISNLPMLKEHFAAMNGQETLKMTSFYTVVYGMLGFIDGVVHRWFRAGMDYPLRDEIPVISEVLFNGFVGQRAGTRTFLSPPNEG